MRMVLMSVAMTATTLTVTNYALSAQSKTIPGELVTTTATVEAIDKATRTLTVKEADGDFVPITVPKSVERFDEIKVGDTITARYYDNIVIRLKLPGEPAVDRASEGLTRATGESPAATAAMQRTITATIVAIDRSVPSITFKGEQLNWNYSSRVADKAALAKVKEGDRVDITWTEAVTVSVTSPAKKK
jgi:Cu/Ag efflux protein CusF